MILDDTLNKIKNCWFLMEPAYYIVLAMQKIVYSEKTNNISCGRGNIYINVDFFKDKSQDVLEEYLKIECLRILLEHPYQRVPPDRRIAYLSSNILISEYLKFKYIALMTKDDIGLHGDKCYEDIYNFISDKLKINKNFGSKKNKQKDSGDGDSSGICGDSSILSELGGNFKNGDDLCKSDDDCIKNTSEWDDDEIEKNVVNGILERIKKTGEWGSIPKPFVDLISVLDEPKFDYRSVIRLFRRDVISSTKTMTRMKPNRRYGYLQMGTKPGYSANVLLVVDTSGSMGRDEIGKYLGLIGGFFRYGFSSVDVIQFDIEVYDETLQSFTKKPKLIKSVSRGGTSIEDILDYVNNRAKKKYGGVVLCSDGGFFYDKNKWTDSNIGDTKYLFCIDSKMEYDSLKEKINDKIKITYIETNVSY